MHKRSIVYSLTVSSIIMSRSACKALVRLVVGDSLSSTEKSLRHVVVTSCETPSSVRPFHSKVASTSVAKRTRSGLFAGKRIMSGNNVSDDGGNRTRRVWKPNAQNATLYSSILDRKIRFKVTPSALRNIDKAGGLDNYLLHSKEAFQSEQGRKIREEIARLAVK